MRRLLILLALLALLGCGGPPSPVADLDLPPQALAILSRAPAPAGPLVARPEAPADTNAFEWTFGPLRSGRYGAFADWHLIHLFELPDSIEWMNLRMPSGLPVYTAWPFGLMPDEVLVSLGDVPVAGFVEVRWSRYGGKFRRTECDSIQVTHDHGSPWFVLHRSTEDIPTWARVLWFTAPGELHVLVVQLDAVHEEGGLS